MSSATRRPRRWPPILRTFRARPRLVVAGVVGLVVLALLPAGWRSATRQLVAWNTGVSLYLLLIYTLMARSTINSIRARAATEDEGQVGILALTVAAALASLGAIVVELGASAQRAPAILAIATILLSWAFTHTIFALHYAHQFYREGDDGADGLVFPGGADPDYWDFVYFSFVIGMTSQVSDVAVASRTIRRTVTAHGIISFLFNAALVALTVNIAANFVMNAQH